MAKKNNKKKENKIKFNSKFFMSIFILILMVLSIIGFAMISAGPTSNNGNSAKDIPLQYFEQYGVWAAVINSEQFIFKDINQYKNNLILKSISEKIKSKEYLNIFYQDNFDPSSKLLLEKALKALKINYGYINNSDCSNLNDLIVGYNKLNSTNNKCIQFIANQDNAYNQTNGLIYYLIK